VGILGGGDDHRIDPGVVHYGVRVYAEFVGQDRRRQVHSRVFRGEPGPMRAHPAGAHYPDTDVSTVRPAHEALLRVMVRSFFNGEFDLMVDNYGRWWSNRDPGSFQLSSNENGS
jgi:hypothetical protein